ncbi:MAG TPA: hypothetical protein P5079_11835, partial [Elusimicrobiota bacterium]|nr:hypothetical protein [Elusimicrobiota bacterium]
RISVRGVTDADSIGPAFLLFLPWLFGIRRRLPKVLLAVGLTLWFVPAVFSGIARFRLPALAVFALLIGSALEEEFSWSPRKKTAYALLFLAALANFIWGSLTLFSFGGWEVAFGLKSKSDYLNHPRKGYPTPYYSAAEFVNKAAPPTGRVLLIGEARGYYLKKPFIAASVFNTQPMVSIANASPTPDDLYERLQAMGITHILVNAAETLYLHKNWPEKFSAAGRETFDAFWQKHALPVFIDAGPGPSDFRRVAVFELVPDREALQPLRPRIPNPLLEILDGGNPGIELP